MGDYVSRLAKDVTRFSTALQSAKADNAALADALELSEAELAQRISEQQALGKLHPLFVVLILQFLQGGISWAEERYAEGKPYVALPGAVVTATGAVVAYLLGAPQAGDGLLAALNACAGVINVRFFSRKGAQGRKEAQARAESEEKKTEEKG